MPPGGSGRVRVRVARLVAHYTRRAHDPEGKLRPMCYSSQIAAAYQQYLKLTGATIDFDQFREVYGFRHADSSIRIPRAVDRWFNEPKNADERSIKELHRSTPDRGHREARG